MPLFPPIDNWFRESIKDDIQIFDRREVMRLEHITDNATITKDVDGVWDGTTQRNKAILEIPNCLQRQPSLRDGSSVPQLHERSVAIQKDSFVKYDTVIEVPFTFIDENDVLVNVEVREGDTITRIQSDNETYRIMMVDKATLETRWRLGCSKFT
jgi:hypothetical protein